MSAQKPDILDVTPSDPASTLALQVYRVDGKDCGQGYSGSPYDNLGFPGDFES